MIKVQRSDTDPGSKIGTGIYKDTGCSLAASCLSCPLAECRYDYDVSRAAADIRQAQAHDLKARGRSVRAIAAKLGLATRTVHRYLETAPQKRAVEVARTTQPSPEPAATPLRLSHAQRRANLLYERG